MDGVSISLSWGAPPLGGSLLVSYTLSCSVDGEQSFSVVLNPIQQFTLEEQSPSTTYTCSIFGTTRGGDGPAATIIITTSGLGSVLVLVLNRLFTGDIHYRCYSGGCVFSICCGWCSIWS